MLVNEVTIEQLEELKKEGNKTYENDEIVVFWDPSKCQHAGECVKGAPLVFDPNKRPWITLENDSNENIIKTIQKCPSGALRFCIKDKEGKPECEEKLKS